MSGEHRRDRDCAEGQANVRNGLKAAAKRMVRLRPEAAIPADAANVPFSPKADNRLQPTPCLAADLRLTPKHCVFGLNPQIISEIRFAASETSSESAA